MGWDGVAWMIGGGVKHSVNVARLVSHVAFGGREGIVGATDLQVRERAVPAGSVRVAPGACAILNKAAGVAYDSYAARMPTEDTVDITATGSGGWRTDLIVARIENPFIAGEPYDAPSEADIAAGNVQFAYTRVIPGILSGAGGAAQHPTAAQIKAALVGMSAIPLASIAIPASTATITQALIQDQRALAQVRERTLMRVVNVGSTITLDATYKTIASTPVEVPEWATHFTIAVMASGVAQATGSAAGGLRGSLGATDTDITAWNSVVANADRIIAAAGASDVAVPVAYRGTTQNLIAKMSKSSGTPVVTADTSSSVRLDIVFSCKPESL